MNRTCLCDLQHPATLCRIQSTREGHITMEDGFSIDLLRENFHFDFLNIISLSVGIHPESDSRARSQRCSQKVSRRRPEVFTSVADGFIGYECVIVERDLSLVSIRTNGGRSPAPRFFSIH